MSKTSSGRAQAARIHLDRLASHSNRIFEHWIQALTSLQDYSNEMTSLASDTLSASKPDLVRYITDSVNIAITFYGDLCQSCADLTGSCQSVQPGEPSALSFSLDQYSESADAQAVSVSPNITLSNLRKTDLVFQGAQPIRSSFSGKATIPASHVRITTLGVAGTILVSLIDLQALLIAGTNQIPQGLYIGAIFETVTNTPVAILTVTFSTVSCP